MASVRRLPSGKWQAQVRLPDSRRISRTDPLKRVVADWAAGQEARLRTDQWHDPRPARRVTLEGWRADWLTRRVVAPATLDKNESHWATHIRPTLGRRTLDTLTRDVVLSWIAGLHRAGVGPHTIDAAAHHLAKMLTDAVDAGLLLANPAARLTLPAPDLRAPFFWTREEAADLLRTVDDDQLRTMLDLDLHVGLRIGELLGLSCGQVDWQAGVIHVTAAQTRHGRVQITKGRSRRTVPIPPHLLDELLELVSGRPADALVFPAPNGEPFDDTNFRHRVFAPAVAAAKIRRGSPHDMRHTAASWLVMAGVDLYRVQALLGHESFRTTQRYAHLAPDAFDKITDAWTAFRSAASAAAPVEPAPDA